MAIFAAGDWKYLACWRDGSRRIMGKNESICGPASFVSSRPRSSACGWILKRLSVFCASAPGNGRDCRGPDTMSATLKVFLQRWLINTVAVMVAARIVRGIECDSICALFATSLLRGVCNAVLPPLLWLLSLPLVILTGGLLLL